MELFISTTEEKEKEVKTAFMGAIRKLSGYPVLPADIKVEFVFKEEDFINVQIFIRGAKEAFSLVDVLYNDAERFLRSLQSEVSEELFKYLLFNNRISYMSFYLNLYRKVRLTILEELSGEKHCHELLIRK
ncbi:hypothetical protein GZH53_17240 [Flavihumibacter sp. R14]|nr:hypothetical protein [Flavihumibacter soli]